MICPNCHEEFDSSLDKCPNCGFSIDCGETIELPKLNDQSEEIDIADFDFNNDNKQDDRVVLKIDDDQDENAESDTKEYVFNFEAKNSITDKNDYLGDTKEFTSLPLFVDDFTTREIKKDDINEKIVENEEINNMNNDKEIKEKSSLVDVKEDKTYNTKRKYLFATSLICLIILGLVIFAFTQLKNDNDTKELSNYDCKNEIKVALDDYYKTGGDEVSGLIKVLEKTYDSGKNLEVIQKETKEIINSWLDEYAIQESENSKGFLDVTNYYKKLIENLYEKTVYENIYLISKVEKDEYLEEISDIYDDGIFYYEALDYYNDVSYNEAYVSLDEITEESKFYDKASELKDVIVNVVIDMMKKDITKVEGDLDNKTDSEKTVVYENILSIIEQYDIIYSDLSLSDNDEYNEILSKYSIYE